MRVAQGHRAPEELHFTEGEPDLEPPEELCISEIDAETQLEEELDNEDVLEQDVDEDTLEVTLEDLVHGADVDLDVDGDRPEAGGPDGEEATEPGPEGPTAAALVALPVDDEEDATVDADFEVGLDIVLLERLALLDGTEEDGSGDGGFGPVALRRPGEFVCRGCFLVRTRTLLADPVASLCRDCAT